MKLRHLHLLTATALLTVLPSTTATAQQYDNYRGNLRDTNVKVDATNLPIVFINVGGNTILRDEYILAHMKIIDNGEGQLNHADTTAYPGQRVDYEGWTALKYRGNSSFNESDKKPLGFQTLERDLLPTDGGKKQKVKLLGMAKDNKWCLLAPWCDETMVRDVLSFELGRPWFDWVPQARMCEVLLDGTYYGVYVLTERVSKGKHRLNLDDPGTTDGDMTGDYHVAVDHGFDPYFTSRYRPWQTLDGSKVSYKYQIKYEFCEPDEEDFAELPANTRQALINEVNKMEDSFMATNWKTQEGYRKRIDVQSFIDYMLSTEASMNIDGYRLSTHLYKHGEKRAQQEGLDPRWKTTLWDFNIAWGNANYYDGQTTDRWQYELNVNFPQDDCPVPFYWYRMLQDEAYVEALKERWQQYRRENYSDRRIMQTVDSLASIVSSGGAADRNEQAWGIYGRGYIWPLYYYATNYADAVGYMKGWIRRRLQFMDSQLLPPRTIETTPIDIATGWNADIVAEALPAVSYTTQSVDAANRSFYASTARTAGSLPDSRELTSANEGRRYRLADYDGYNALSLMEYGATGTLLFDGDVETTELFLLGTSGNGEALVQVTLNYADGTTGDAGTMALRDWSVRTEALQGNEAVARLGNIRRDNDAFSTDNHYCLFDCSIPVDGRPLQSITLTSVGTGYANIMAISRLVDIDAGIQPVMASHDAATRRAATYNVAGMQLQGSSRGLTIVRQSDGTVRKVLRRR